MMMARIEAGLIMAGLDHDEISTPWECRMGWAVDLKKSDFQGKAALPASKPAPRVTVVAVAFPDGTEGLDGAEVTANGKVIGAISMAFSSPLLDGKMLAMARINAAHAVVGTGVEASGASGTMVDLPVHDPERKRARS